DGLSADEPPDALSWTDVGVPVHRGGDTQGAGVGDRFAQQVDERVLDAGVLHAAGSEQKLHAGLLYVSVMTPSSRVGERVHGKQTGHHSETHRGWDQARPPKHTGRGTQPGSTDAALGEIPAVSLQTGWFRMV